MSSNERAVRERYEDGREDGRASASRASGLEFHYTKRLLAEYVGENADVAEIGCATGYYGLYLSGRCGKYMGVDLSRENIAVFQDKIKKAGLCNVTAQVGDATDLRGLPDGRFDAVLVLGPMYHLPPEERLLAFRESVRVLKRGGVVLYAYISGLGAYLKASLDWPEVYPNARANEYVLRRGTDDVHTDLFFFASPEEMAACAARCGLTVLKNVGVDYSFREKWINAMDDAQFAAWMELSDRMFESESCTALSNHAVLVCQKP